MQDNAITVKDSSYNSSLVDSYNHPLDRLPDNVSYLSPKPNEEVKLRSIILKYQPTTLHLTIENFQPSEYYQDYLMTTSHSEKVQLTQKQQVERLIELKRGRIESLVEIGCGDGSFMKHASERIPKVVGIEPSQRFSSFGKRQGLQIIDGYVGSQSIPTSDTFDAFASRQVFEHLSDPLDVLIGIKKMLNEGAVGLIEVPNGFSAILNQRFFEFFPDHVNYFSVNSLVNLASEAGFNVICCHESFGGDYLELWLRNVKNIKYNIHTLQLHRDRVIASIREKISQNVAEGKRTVIWGAGAKTLTIFSGGLGEVSDFVPFVIDSDPHKHGRYIPNTSTKVVSPDELLEIKIDTLIVLALSFVDEIKDQISSKFPLCKEVLTVDNVGNLSIA